MIDGTTSRPPSGQQQAIASAHDVADLDHQRSPF